MPRSSRGARREDRTAEWCEHGAFAEAEEAAALGVPELDRLVFVEIDRMEEEARARGGDLIGVGVG